MSDESDNHKHNWQKESRQQWMSVVPHKEFFKTNNRDFIDRINTGCLQRIADALEGIAIQLAAIRVNQRSAASPPKTTPQKKIRARSTATCPQQPPAKKIRR